MYNIFSCTTRHKILEANVNFYALPFIHPNRNINQHDFIYMLHGEWIFGQNGEIFQLEDDHILILAANQQHYGITPCSRNTKTMYFHASCENGDLFVEELPPKNDEHIYTDILINASANKNLKKIFSNVVNSKLDGNDKRASIYFELLLDELSKESTSPAKSDIAMQIKNIIHNNPEVFFSNSELAKATKVSLKTAENKFRETFGISIHQYALNYKIDEALSYFRIFPEMTIKEISYNLGFYDEYHFSRQFKKATGFSPLEYKKKFMS